MNWRARGSTARLAGNDGETEMVRPAL